MPRAIAGRLPNKIEPGVIMGPTTWGEYVVALETDGEGTEFGWATTKDIDAALGLPAPRSVTEHHLRLRARAT